MLVLSRKQGQQIYLFVPGISDPIVIEVAQIWGLRAQIGIEAAKEIEIVRREVYEHNLAEARRRGEQPLTLPPKPL